MDSHGGQQETNVAGISIPISTRTRSETTTVFFDKKNDVAMAVSKYDQFDFLIDIVPREDARAAKRPVSARARARARERENESQTTGSQNVSF